jgi:hypothetical protein
MTESEPSGPTNRPAHLLRLDVPQGRQPKGQGLARASGGNADEVVARHDDGPALRLDGRGDR